MVSEGGSYIKKNGKLELVERTEWPNEADALVKPTTAEPAEAEVPASEGGAKPNSGKKVV